MNRKYLTVLVGLFIVFLYHLPFLILGHESFLKIHDNLDSEFIYLHVLKISGNLFGLNPSVAVPNIFNGIPRGYFHSEFSFMRVLFYFFPSFWAYVLNSLIVRSIGYVGILVLAESYFPKEKKQLTIIIIGVCFSLLPIYPIYGLSIMGQPLLLWAFLNLLKSNKLFLSFGIIVLFPMYAHLAMVAPFILTCLFLYGIVRYIKHKEITLSYWIGICILFISFIGFNYLTVNSFLSGSELSHRTDMISNKPIFITTLKSIYKTVLYGGQYHSATFITIPIIGLLTYGVWNRSLEAKKGLWIFIIITFFAGFHEFYDYLAYHLGSNISILTTFNFGRFTFLMPLLFFLILLLLNQDRKIKKSIFYFGVSVIVIGEKF